MKDDRERREDDREVGTNGDDRKGALHSTKLLATFADLTVSMESPIPAHDELDTAE